MNLASLGDRNIESFGEYTALVFGDREYTNVELYTLSKRFATALAELGIGPGDRVGVLLPNMPEVGTCYGAILRMGAIAVPMVFLLAVPEIKHILADSAAKAIITSPEFYGNVTQALEGLEPAPIVIVTGDAPAPTGALSFEQLLAGATREHDLVERDDKDLAVVSYTSGTTGRPKGVMLTHGNLLFTAEAVSSIVKPEGVSIGCLPLAHLFGIFTSITVQRFKVKNILLPWFTAEGFFEAVEKGGGIQSAVVPTMLAYMLSHPGFDDVDWSNFQWMVVSAAPVPLELADEFEKRTGARVLEAYGMTETSPSVSLMRRADPRRPGSCGKPIPGIEVAILDDDDRPMPTGEPGEVCIRGPNVMAGYYNMPEETENALRNGWLHSGDVGYMDEDGYLYITERKKDLIIRGGFNIYPRDVEEVLYGHPSVLEAAVVGVPDAKLGEEVKAYVVLRPGMTATEGDLFDYCCDHLAKFKTPKSVTFLDELPKNPIGKVLKKDLRALAAQDG
jgi:long-chain acyl-CoA synthetase